MLRIIHILRINNNYVFRLRELQEKLFKTFKVTRHKPALLEIV